MRMRTDHGTKIFLLAFVIALLIALTGGFSVDRARRLKREFFRVAEQDIPLASVASRIETLQLRQSFTVQRARNLAHAGEPTEITGRRLDALRTTFEQEATALREALEEGRRIAAQIAGNANATGGLRDEGAAARSLLAGLDKEYREYAARARLLLERLGGDGWKGEETAEDAVEAEERDVQEQLDAFREGIGQFTARSARAVERHEGAVLRAIVIFSLLTFGTGLGMLLLIRRVIREQREGESKLRYLAVHDPLSGLYNRRHVLELLETAVAAAHRYGHALSFCLCDIDLFKQINDTHGHRAGDEVIRQFGALIRQEIRADDVAGRYGGDEFCLLLSHAGADAAREVLERIRGRLETLTFRSARDAYFQAAATFGCAEMDPERPYPKELIEAADRALYRAKEAGRNRVVCLGPEQTAP